MKVIINKIIPFKGFLAINLFGVVFAREELSKTSLNHEAIHTAQMKEMWYIPFYLWYFIEWIVRLFTNTKSAYKSISFEREAYKYQRYAKYLSTRRKFYWMTYLKK